MFGTNHIILLAITIAIIVILTICSVKFRFSLKTASIIVVSICAASYLECMINRIVPVDPENPSLGMVLDPTRLHLHLCSIMIYFYIAILFLKEGKLKERLKSFAAVIGLIGPICSLLIPTEGTSFANPDVYEYFLYHLGMIWFALYLIITKQVNLKLSAYLSNLAILGILLVLSLAVNSILSVYHANYFFTARPPMENLPILNLDNGWHVYILTLIAIGIIVLTLFHLPTMIKEAIEKKKAKADK